MSWCTSWGVVECKYTSPQQVSCSTFPLPIPTQWNFSLKWCDALNVSNFSSIYGPCCIDTSCRLWYKLPLSWNSRTNAGGWELNLISGTRLGCQNLEQWVNNLSYPTSCYTSTTSAVIVLTTLSKLLFWFHLTFHKTPDNALSPSIFKTTIANYVIEETMTCLVRYLHTLHITYHLYQPLTSLRNLTATFVCLSIPEYTLP